MSKKYINEIEWSKIFSFLQSQKNIYTKKEVQCKNFMEAIFWMVRTGAQWRELPEKYGNWNSVFSRFNTWSKKQIWGNLFKFCVQDPDLEYVMIDATIVRAHACAAGYGNQETEGLGRSKGGFTTKIHVKVDALGNPLKFIITPGQRNDITKAIELVKNESGENLLGDKAYDVDYLRELLEKQGSNAVIPPKSNRINQYEYDKHIYKERHAIECFFGKIKQFRRIFSRFDKSARNFGAFFAFAGAFIWLR